MKKHLYWLIVFDKMCLLAFDLTAHSSVYTSQLLPCSALKNWSKRLNKKSTEKETGGETPTDMQTDIAEQILSKY